jgi:hypothetical protein
MGFFQPQINADGRRYSLMGYYCAFDKLTSGEARKRIGREMVESILPEIPQFF